MKELNNTLFNEFKKLRGTKEKVAFIQEYFWNYAKIKENYIVDYSGLLNQGELILRIFQYSLLNKNMIIATEANLVCCAINTLHSSESIRIIEKYNWILVRAPQYRKEFEINNN